MFKLFFKYKLKLINILINIFLLDGYLNCGLKEPVGLINIGNTCYMNSLLQMLFSMDDLNKLINLNKNKYNSNSIILSYIKVYDEYQKAKSPYKPISFCTRIQEEKNVSGKAIFPRGVQADSVELLIFFLRKLSTDIINSPDLRKKIDDMLKIEPVDYNKNVLIESPFIAGPIVFIDSNNPDKLLCSNLLDCLKYYFSNQFLGGKIKHIPEYLFILYSLEKNTGKIKKVPEFGFKLNLGKLDNKRDLNYELLATLNHMGESLSSGHYISLVNRGKNFYKCDDQSIERINGNIDEFLKNLANNKDNIQNKYGTPKVILYKSAQETKRDVIIDINDIFVRINDINDIITRINLPQETIKAYLNYIHTSFDDIKQMLNNKNMTLADLSRNIADFLNEQKKEYEKAALFNKISFLLNNKPNFIDFQSTFKMLEVYKNNLKK